MDEKNRPASRVIYNVLGLTAEGRKDLLRMYIAKSEETNFRLSVLIDLQNRGVCNILIACVDGLKSFPDAIASIFPQTTVQLCIIHHIRNSVRYVASKAQKEFMGDMKKVYSAVNKDAAKDALLYLGQKRVRQYPVVIRSWQENWEQLLILIEYFIGINQGFQVLTDFT